MPENNIKIWINGKEATVKKGSYLLGAIKKAGFDVPVLCHHKDLTPEGSCRLCVCEVEDSRGRKKLVTACNYPVQAEIKVSTDSEKVLQHRKILADMYLSRWPNVPIILEIAKKCGVTEPKFKSEITDENEKACVLCGRCTRACKEFTLEKILHFAGRGTQRHIAMPFGEEIGRAHV